MSIRKTFAQRKAVQNQSLKRLDALSLANRMWESIDSPISLSCYILAKYKDFDQLVRKSIDPSTYLDPREFYLDYQSVKTLSKYPYLDTGIRTSEVAVKKFIEAEVLCQKTNERFRLRDSGELLHPRVERILSYASRKISLILGDVPKLSDLDFSFGPGSAFGVRGDTSVFAKVTSNLECTYAFNDTLQEFLEEFPGWFPEGIHRVSLIPGSRLMFVPKDAKTDRPICVEPLLNGLMQKGIGTYVSRRLSHHGINLNDQSTNQRLAKLAIEDCLATVDFSSASDTVAYRLVMDLLPIEWFEFLDVARCPRYEFEGVWRSFQKFSSMGNAYTFELESLIFYALACGCCEELGIPFETGVNLSVYGDDVIIPRDAFDLFSEVTVACGFMINKEKSFHNGLFYESCGHDYFMGHLVRPFLFKKKLNKLLPAFYAANTIRRLQKRLREIPFPAGKSDIHHVDRRFDDLHAWIVGCIPHKARFMGPEGYGDGHLIVEFDACCPARHPSWDGWWFRSWAERAVRVKLDTAPMPYALYFTRHQRPRQEGALDYSKVVQLEDVPEPTDNGTGYAIRGKTRISSSKLICHGEWPSIKFSSFDKMKITFNGLRMHN